MILLKILNQEYLEDKILNINSITNLIQIIKNKLECVYFIKEGDDDIFKVGYIGNLIERLQTLQVGNSRNLSVYKTIICKSASFYEKFIHHNIQKYHIKGEWYRLSKDLIDSLISDIK